MRMGVKMVIMEGRDIFVLLWNVSVPFNFHIVELTAIMLRPTITSA
jgi:hypothetical protein